MKFKALMAGLLAAVPALLQAQTVTYSLPRTTVVVEVDAVQETFYAGPYARFARKYLGIDAEQRDAVRVSLQEIRLLTRVEGDPAARYSADIKGGEDRFLALSSQGLVSFQDKAEAGDHVWRFDPQARYDFSAESVTSPTRTEVRTVWKEVQTDTAMVQVPVEESYEVEKTVEMRAQEAAQMVLKARRERFNITVGNTDATYSGEALGAAIRELERVEKEYLRLFVGRTVRRPLKESFDVIPQPGTQKYLAFRLSDADGIVTEGSAMPYYLEITPESVVEGGVRDAKNAIRYRIPAPCLVKLTADGNTLLKTRIPVFQLGAESTLPLK
ncbi:MAG: DUF4831 family protein [Bacteroidales bacterium]|nr:DUF4831 family protein [Bacteroidales bacterium]